MAAADQHDSERRQERDRRRQRGAADPVSGIADGGDGRDDRPGVTWPSATAFRNWAEVIQW